MTEIDRLFVRIEGDVSRLRAKYDEARRETDSLATKISRALFGIDDAWLKVGRGADVVTAKISGVKAALLGLGVGVALKSVIDTTKEFGALKASLETVTGSAPAAEAAFAQIAKFAATTPFDLQQVTQAFIRLKALGLDPSMEALASYGNTASSLGTPMMQFVEAVADAVTGEFERLKEYGIRASKQGDEVAFVFQGVTTKVANNAAAIEGYLRSLGNVQFAGAMERQSRTLLGALSNLSDAFSTLLNAVGEGEFADALTEIATEMADMAGEGHDLAQILGGELADGARGAWQAVKWLADHLELVKAVGAALIGLRLGATFGPWGAAAGVAAGLILTLATNTDQAKTAAEELEAAIDRLNTKMREQKQDAANAGKSMRDLADDNLKAAQSALAAADATLAARKQLLADQGSLSFLSLSTAMSGVPMGGALAQNEAQREVSAAEAEVRQAEADLQAAKLKLMQIEEDMRLGPRAASAGGGAPAAPATPGTPAATEKMIAEGERLKQQVETHAEKVARLTAHYKELADAGVISQETLARALAELNSTASAGTKKLNTEGEQLAQQVETHQEKVARLTAHYRELAAAGVISQQTLVRALAELDSVAAATLDVMRSEGDALTQQVETHDEKVARLSARYQELAAAGVISQRTLERALAALNASSESTAQDLTQVFTDAGRDIASTLTSAILGAEGDIGASILRISQRLAEMIIQIQLIDPALKAITGSGSGSGSILGSLASWIGSGVSSVIGGGVSTWGNTAAGGNGSLSYGGPRAFGGAVDPNHWYTTGETGPEVFVPSAPGQIVSNRGLRDMASGTGGRPVNVSMTVVANDAGSFRRSESQIAAAMARATRLGQRNQ